MKVLLLGGTGAMGKYLSALLSERGDDVYVTSRSHHPDQEHLFFLRGDAHDMEFMRETLNNSWDAIVDFMSYRVTEFSSRVGLLLKNTKQYIFLSSSRVYSDSTNPLTETSPRLLEESKDTSFLETEEYSLTKAREEDILKGSGLKNYTIVRPYLTYETYRLQLGDMEKESWLYRALSGRTIVFSSDMAECRTTMTYGKDVAVCVSKIIGNETTFGEIYNPVSNVSYTWKEVLAVYQEIIGSVTGVCPKVKWTGKSDSLLSSTKKYQVLYDRYFDRTFDNKKIESLDRDIKFTPLRDGIYKCLTDFIKAPSFKPISYLEEGRKDSITGDRLALSKIPGAKDKVVYFLCRYCRLYNLLKKLK